MTLENRLKWRGSPMPTASGITRGFGKGVEPANLRLCGHGGTHVSLGDDWVGLTRGLRALGDVFASTQNPAAALTQMGRFPEFNLCACGRFATNQFGGLGFDFAEWHRVWATRRAQKNGAWHTLSIVDRDEWTSHQILLAGEVNEMQFASFAREFQGAPNPQPRWPVRGEGVCTGYLERFQNRKWGFVEADGSGAERWPTGALPALLEAVLAEQLCLSVTVVSAPVIQSSLWTPTQLEQRDGWLALSAELTQLRLRLSAVSEAWVVPLPVEAGGGVALECYDERDCLLFGISAADDQENRWKDLLGSARRA